MYRRSRVPLSFTLTFSRTFPWVEYFPMLNMDVRAARIYAFYALLRNMNNTNNIWMSECYIGVRCLCVILAKFMTSRQQTHTHAHSSRLFEKIVFNFKRTLNIARREWTAFLQNFPRRTETWENLSKLVISLQQLERMGWLCSEWLFGWVRLSNEWFLFVGKSVEKQIKRKWFLGENFAGAKWLLFGLGSWICWTGNPGQTAEKRVKLHIHTKSAHENMRTKTRRRARAREKERDKVRWRQSSGTGIEWGKHITDEHKAKSRKHHTNIYLN